MGVAFLFSTIFHFTYMFTVCFGFNLTILHTNDIHARFEEISKYGGKCRDKDKSAGKCFGGTARLMSKIKENRNLYPNSILLDAGDQYSGTLWFYKYGGTITAKVTNILGYDVMTLGNHEFDRGVKGLVPFLDAINFTVVSCNINATNEPRMRDKFSTRHVLSVGGETIGIIGFTTPDTQDISMPGPTLLFQPEIALIQAEVDALEKQGINKIIVLTHAGFNMDKHIASVVRGIDVIVGGHSHTFLYTGTPPSNEVASAEYPYIVTREDGSRVLYVQDYAYSKYLGFLQVDFDENGFITKWNGNPILLDKSVEKDAAMLTELEPYKQGVQNETEVVIGRTQVFLEGGRHVCRTAECNIGNLITDGMIYQNLKHPDSSEWNHVAVAVINSGGIRSSILQGDISIGDVLSILPFRNTVDIVELRGKHIVGMLENSISRYFKDKDRLFGGFLQMSGLRVTYDISKPVGKRVVKVQIRCANCMIPEFGDIDHEEVYKVILPSFIATGNDFYTVIKENTIKRYLLGVVDSDVMIKYIKERSPIVSGLDERITILNGTRVCVKYSTGQDDLCSVKSAGLPASSYTLWLIVFSVLVIIKS